MDIGVLLDLGNFEMRFPKTAGPSDGDVKTERALLKLEVVPQVQVGGTVEGHLTPRVSLGVDLINGFSKANVFVDLDMTTTTTLGVQAQAIASNAKDPKAKDAATSGVKNGFSRCIQIDQAFDARAGTDGTIPGFFDKSTAIPIFSKKFELFKASSSMCAPSTIQSLTPW